MPKSSYDYILLSRTNWRTTRESTPPASTPAAGRPIFANFCSADQIGVIVTVPLTPPMPSSLFVFSVKVNKVLYSYPEATKLQKFAYSIPLVNILAYSRLTTQARQPEQLTTIQFFGTSFAHKNRPLSPQPKPSDSSCPNRYHDRDLHTRSNRFISYTGSRRQWPQHLRKTQSPSFLYSTKNKDIKAFMGGLAFCA